MELNQSITAFAISFRSSKSNQKGERLVRGLVRRDDSFGHGIFIDMMIRFAVFVGYDDANDLFFSRPHESRLRGRTLGDPMHRSLGQELQQAKGRKRYRSEESNSVVKACAIRFGLPAKGFSTKSFKYLGISTINEYRIRNDGLSEEQMKAMFDHRSVSSNRHYQRNLISGPLFHLTSEGKGMFSINIEA